ncbi:peptide ABC transporter substrate-binding protein [Haemophilus haemolyticus]|uniref:peptide ABC transporter substrate-binding protein n=1 Tax=Haemophilus haemolyticus TaxID=726 RepID=UPI000E589C85|nr:peptide ABC transporter substrate-binding protein [Haemophilus haemolyticus]
MNNFLALCQRSAVIFSIVFTVVACDKLDNPKPVSPQVEALKNTQLESNRVELKRGVYGDLTLQPWQAQSEEQTQLLRDLFEGLTAYDAQGNLVPAVAETWQTKDNKIWIFTLRENAKWSNGEVVTASDFVQSWQALSQSESPLKNYLAFMNLKNAKAVLEKTLAVESLGLFAENDRTLRIELDKASPYLPSMLAHVSLLPRYAKPTEILISNGAYQLQSQVENQHILTANPYYWAKEKVIFQQVKYQKIVADADLSDFDVVINPQKTVQNIQDYPQLCTYFYEFNLADPMLQKSAVRKAIVSMVSTKNLVADITHLHPSNTFLPKSMLGEQESVWEPVVAEQLLSQNQISETRPLKLRIRYDDSSLNQTIATRLNRQLSQSDLLRVENQGMGWQELQMARTKGDFQLIRSGWCADFNDPVAFLNLFYSKSPDNKNGYKNAEFDRLFESAMTTISEKVRLENYAKLKGIVQQEYLVLPVFQYSTPVYLAPSIMGAQVNSVGTIYSKDLWRKVKN